MARHRIDELLRKLDPDEYETVTAGLSALVDASRTNHKRRSEK